MVGSISSAKAAKKIKPLFFKNKYQLEIILEYSISLKKYKLYDEAVELLKPLINEENENWEVFRELGANYKKLWEKNNNDDDLIEAIKNLESAVENNPIDIESLSMLGGIEWRRDNFNLAAKKYLEAFEYDEGNIYPLTGLSFSYWLDNQMDEAKESYEKLETVTENQLNRPPQASENWTPSFWSYFSKGQSELFFSIEHKANKTTIKTYKEGLNMKPAPSDIQSELDTLEKISETRNYGDNTLMKDTIALFKQTLKETENYNIDETSK